MPRSCAHLGSNTTKNERFWICRISERKVIVDNISEMGKLEVQIQKPRILVSRILCRYGWKNTKKIAEYIRNQLKEDEEIRQLSIDFDEDPFTGSK